VVFVFTHKYMPVEGLPTTEPATPAAPATPAPNTPDEAANSTAAAAQPGPGTQPAQQPEAPTEPTFTQAQVNAMIAKRLPAAVKSELKKMSGDGEGQPSTEDLQRQLSERDQKLRSFEAKDKVAEFLADGRNKLNVDPKHIRGIEALVIPLLEYDDAGQPSNLKEAIESAKQIAPVLFTIGTPGINAGAGGKQPVTSADMNGFIRQQAGYGN